MFVEIAFLQKLVLLVHHPTVALALVLATFLLGAGAGSTWSSHVPAGRSRAVLAGAVAAIVLLGAVYGQAFDALNAALAGGRPRHAPCSARRCSHRSRSAWACRSRWRCADSTSRSCRGLGHQRLRVVVSAALATLLAVTSASASCSTRARALRSVVLVFPAA